jgi:hypothetical protein
MRRLIIRWLRRLGWLPTIIVTPQEHGHYRASLKGTLVGSYGSNSREVVGTLLVEHPREFPIQIEVRGEGE